MFWLFYLRIVDRKAFICLYVGMRTTLNINDVLYRKVKIKAAKENRTVTELVETALHRLFDDPKYKKTDFPKESKFGIRISPIKTKKLNGVRPLDLSVEETSELVKEVELSAEGERYHEAFRH